MENKILEFRYKYKKYKKPISSTRSEAFYCKLTEYLDDLAFTEKHYDVYKHYILLDVTDLKSGLCAIRVPGGTVGCVMFDVNTKEIIEINIDTKYVVKTYPENVYELVNKEFVGYKLKFEIKNNMVEV